MPMISLKFSENSPWQAVRRGCGGALGLFVLAMVAGVLAACAPIDRRPLMAGNEAAQLAREAEIARNTAWTFTGRLAISQGDNGGNAHIEWRQDGADFDIRLSAPITRQSWRLRQAAGKISLEGMDGGLREGSDPEILLQEATGWKIPVSAMSAWVRGVRAQGSSDLSFDEHGLPATINQGDWAVQYRGWFPGNPALPSKVFARQGDASVRLIIERWGGQ